LGRELPIGMTTAMSDRVALHQGTFGQQKPFGVREISVLNVRLRERMLISGGSRLSAGTC